MWGSGRHKRPLKYPGQPLLQAKQTHRARNLLARNSVSGKGSLFPCAEFLVRQNVQGVETELFFDLAVTEMGTGAIGLIPTFVSSSGKKKQKKANAKDAEPCSVEIPPELCVVLGVSSSLVRSAYLVPSVMHRMEAALIASDLRRVIREGRLQCSDIPILRVSKACSRLTSGRLTGSVVCCLVATHEHYLDVSLTLCSKLSGWKAVCLANPCSVLSSRVYYRG